MTQSIWTEEIDIAIAEGLKAGLSYTEIGAPYKLNRPQISGRIFRLRKQFPEKLPEEFRALRSRSGRADTYSKSALAKKNSRSPSTYTPAKAKKILQDIPNNSIEVSVPAPTNKPVQFMDLERGQCSFCVDNPSEPAGATMMCCGAPVIDRYAREGDRKASHCEYHYERVVDRSYQALKRIKNARSVPNEGGASK